MKRPQKNLGLDDHFDRFFLVTSNRRRRTITKPKRKSENNMKANAQIGKNQAAPSRDACYLSRRLCLSWLVTLLLATSGTATPATVHVDVGGAGTFFDPADVTIQPGDTVEWDWSNAGPHTVTSGANGISSGLFDSGAHSAPYTFSFTFPNTGTFDATSVFALSIA